MGPTLGRRLRLARGNIVQISCFATVVFCALIKNSRFVINERTSVTFRTNDLRKAIQCFVRLDQ